MGKHKSVYETEYRVQYYETDAMGIVHHSNYIRYFETARTEMLRDHGYPYDRMEKEGMMIPVLGVEAVYKTPAVYDEVLIISCWLEELKGASMAIGYEIRGAADGTVHATGRSRHGFTDSSLKPVRLKKFAPEVYGMLKGLEG